MLKKQKELNPDLKQIQEDILAVWEVVIKDLSYENRSLCNRVSTLEMSNSNGENHKQKKPKLKKK